MESQEGRFHFLFKYDPKVPNMNLFNNDFSRILFLTFILLPSFPAAAGELPPVAVEQSPYHDAEIYGISDRDCTIKWHVYSTDLNKGVIKHWSRCGAPLSEQVPWLSAIFGEIVRRDANAAAFRTLFWGGLMPEQGPSAMELPVRLALAAFRSTGWDAKRGKPRNGDLNGFVRNLANEADIYPEIKSLFQPFSRAVTIASVEKVRVLPAGKLPFRDALVKLGVGPKDKLPFDCLLWFRVTATDKD